MAAVLAIAILAMGAYVLWPRPSAPIGAVSAAFSADDVEAAQERTVIVYVSGAVQHPGLYTIGANLRVSDAIVAAGGLTPDADPSCLPNLAAHVRAAKEIEVPLAGQCGKV